MSRTSRFESIANHFSPSRLRSSLRRTSSASSTSNNSDYSSTTTSSTSSAVAINSVIMTQPSLVNLMEERTCFGSELSLLEPRPIVYWGGVEERMTGF